MKKNDMDIPKGYRTVGNDVVCFPECLNPVESTNDIQTQISFLETYKDEILADIIKETSEQQLVSEDDRGPMTFKRGNNAN